MKINKISANEHADRTVPIQIANAFQTPLGVIISAGELLEGYFDRLTPDRRRLALEDILDAARQMNQAIDSLITFENDPEKNEHSRNPRRLRNRVTVTAAR